MVRHPAAAAEPATSVTVSWRRARPPEPRQKPTAADSTHAVHLPACRWNCKRLCGVLPRIFRRHQANSGAVSRTKRAVWAAAAGKHSRPRRRDLRNDETGRPSQRPGGLLRSQHGRDVGLRSSTQIPIGRPSSHRFVCVGILGTGSCQVQATQGLLGQRDAGFGCPNDWHESGLSCGRRISRRCITDDESRPRYCRLFLPAGDKSSVPDLCVHRRQRLDCDPRRHGAVA